MQIGADSSYIVTLTLKLDVLNPKSIGFNTASRTTSLLIAKFQIISIRGFRFILLTYPHAYTHMHP